MKEKILALLTAAFTGVRKDGLNQLARILALQATTEAEAKALVEKLTKTQVDDFVKEFRKDVDKEVTDSNKKVTENIKTKFDLVAKKKEGDDDSGGTNNGINPVGNPNQAATGNKKGNPTDIAAIVKAAVAEAVKPFQKALDGYKAEDVAKTRSQLLTSKLDACNDKNFKEKALKDFARMNFETDKDFDDYLSETETDIVTANQNVANLTLGEQGRPWMPNVGGGNKEATRAEIDAVIGKLQI